MTLEQQLFESINEKDERTLIDLVTKGADVNTFNSLNQTPLMVAADKGFITIAAKLILFGADINKSSDYGRTALSYAIAGQKRELKMVQFLVENGADIHSKVPKKDGFYSLRPLVLAALYSGPEIVSYLLDKGAVGKEEVLPFLEYQKNQKMIDVFEGKKKTLRNNLKNIFKYLIYRLPLEEINNVLKPEITEQFLMKKIEQKRDILPFLNEFIRTHNIKTSILPHWAAKYNCVGTLDMLIKVGFPLNFLWLGERTPLTYAALNGNLKAADLLIKNGADVHLTDRFGETVLHRAVRKKDKKMVELLVNAGADVNLESSCILHQTPLMIASENQDEKIAQYLIEKGANVNFVSSSGKTAVSWALERRSNTNIKLLETLLKGGVDLNKSVRLKKNYVATPLEIATRYQDVRVVKFFLKHKAWGKESAFFVAKSDKSKRLMNLLNKQDFQRNN